MARKHKHEEHVNLERWLVSYADFITLLFATFVILYALSQIDLAKFKDLKVSMREAFGQKPSSIMEGSPGMLDSNGSNMMNSNGFNESQNMIPPILAALEAKEEKKQYKLLQEELKLKKVDELKGIKTEVTERGFIIKMMGNIFFDPATSNIRQESIETIRLVGNLIKEKFPYNIIRVEGHTDSEPMKSSVFPSNWELSAFRAASVVRYMTDNLGIDKDRFVTVGYADSRPTASNKKKKGRRANRRVEIVILRSKFLKAELKTLEFQKKRKERLEEIERIAMEKAEKLRMKKEQDSKMSDAAKKLMEEAKDPSEQVILYKDSYDKETKEMMDKLKKYEDENDPAVKKKLFFNSVQKGLKRNKD